MQIIAIVTLLDSYECQTKLHATGMIASKMNTFPRTARGYNFVFLDMAEDLCG